MTDSMYWIGFVGGLMVAIGFVPQIIKALRTRSTGDLSLYMLLTIFVGGLLYTTYAVLVGDPVFIVMNTLATTNTVVLLVLKLLFR
jgi:MtN3 and saliva related transmembrane protein